VTANLLNDALAISDAWSNGLDLRTLIETQLRESHVLDQEVDVVAIGKAAREMSAATRDVLGDRVRRQLVIVDEGPAFSMDSDVEFIIGEHPLPGLGSLLAGQRLVEYLERSSGAHCTIFLISGGASSLCALPASPLDLEDLHELFAAALQSGTDITTLNRLRAASSAIAGGAILRSVRTPRSLSLVMVDNVVSGARWVASGLTFDYEPTRDEVLDLLGVIGRSDTRLASRILDASEDRAELMVRPVTTVHENRVIAEPSQVLVAVADEATRRGYRVFDLGASLHGDVQEIVDLMTARVATETLVPTPFCVVGVGETTVQVRGSGVGGRCQEFAWRMAGAFGAYERDIVAVARATDGRDFVRGIAGGWSNNETVRRARERGIEFSSVLRESDSYSALHELGQLIPGGRTGWNLCDVYLVTVEAVS
jgi:hydroxypyruvate reductase/glycerate 2-kinase